MMNTPGPESGISVARAYWREVVRPALIAHRPGTCRAAARLGSGSEVLGLDDQMSHDHDWGLRLQIFVPEGEQADVRAVLLDHLPDQFAGLPTRFAFSGQDERALAVDVLSLGELISTKIGFDPRIEHMPLDWLSLTGQAVLEMTAGAVFEDSDTTGDLHSRADALVVALQELAAVQSARGLASANPIAVPFWGRPYLQIDQDLVPRVLDAIDDPAIHALPAGLGSVEQRTDNVDLLMHAHLRRATVLAGASLRQADSPS